MPKNDYHNWDKPDLIAEIKALNKRKKYGLVWEDKREDVAVQCREQLPVLEEVKTLAIRAADPALPENLLIEGDNYHALSVLNYTHARKIDVIYIDPPYNTGAKDWKYNNNFVDTNDGYRHSKWLSMMAKRLRLAKQLLKPDGVLICSIDEHEIFTLGVLLDGIFAEGNRLGVVSVVHKPEGRNQKKFFGTSTEFMLVYAKKADAAKFNRVALNDESRARFSEKDAKGNFRLKNFIRLTDGKYSLRENKPHFYYPIWVSPDLRKFSTEPREKYTKVFPITNKGVERTWKTTPKTFMERAKNGDIVARNDENGGGITLFEKLREGEVVRTHWIEKEYHAYHYGTKILETLLGSKKFEFPKSVYLVRDALKITAPDNAVVLDFFAGSGTTGHAVSLLNEQDGGKRRFILCTNNENGIAREVCQPRIKAVTKMHEKHPDITGIPLNLRYFKTAFVAAQPTDKNKVLLTRKAAEMLCMREGTYEPEVDNDDYKIFRNEKRRTGIIYDYATIGKFKKAAAKLGGKFSVYVFSLGDEDFSESFADMRGVVKSRPIPEAILRVYRRIFKQENNDGT